MADQSLKQEYNTAEMSKAEYKDPITHKDVPRDGGPEPKKMEKSAFKKLEHKVEKEGYSDQSAKKIAAAAGIAKYGKAGMEAKAKAGKK